jgi:PEP-CTERM motif
MQRLKHGLAIALSAVIAAEASATAISDRRGDPVPPAATDLAVGSMWDARGVPVPDGEVGTEDRIEGVEPTVIPEPDTLLLVSLGMFGLVVAGRRRQRQSSAA